MKKALIFFLFIKISLFSYGQIIADHTVVDKYDDIPQYYIDEVKKIWLSYAGESHSEAIRHGLEALEAINSIYAVNVTESGTPEAYTTSHLRAGRATWGDLNNETGWVYGYGEEDWFTSATAISRTKAGITYCNSNNLTIGAFGFGWCYDLEVNFNEYISATREYIDYCADTIETKVFFTTGTVDIFTGETGYIKHLGYQLIRDYVASDNSLVLFDYADILCYNDAGELETDTWDGHIFPIIHPDNEEGVSTGHIGMNGALRLARAMWWMLARIAGWDGVTSTVIPVDNIVVSGAGGSSTIGTDGGTLQLTATVSPPGATDKTVTWSIINGTGQATISSSGLVTAVSNGTVTAGATANDGSGVHGDLVITISNQVIPVTGITVSGAGGSSTISTDGGTLQLTATVSPPGATDKTVTWSIINGTGEATINSSGLVTAVANGTVTARATANDGSGVYGELVISISNQIVPVTDIIVSGAGGSSTISTLNGTLQLSVNITPAKATDKTVTWSIVNVTGEATISPAGLVTAVSNGTVTARATANDGSGVYGELTITITNQFVAVSGITINSEGGQTSINIPGGTLQLQAVINPADASDQSVTWEVINGTGEAEISSTGLLTAISEGIVTVRATANDGSGISTTLEIIIEYITYNYFRVIVHEGLIEVLFNEDHTGYNLRLYDFMGSLRYKEIIDGTSCQLNASVLSPGPYYIILSSSVIHEVRKILLVK